MEMAAREARMACIQNKRVGEANWEGFSCHLACRGTKSRRSGMMHSVSGSYTPKQGMGSFIYT